MWIQRFALLVLLFLSVPATAEKLKVEFDKSVDFSKYHTYAWVTGTPAANPFVDQSIIGGINDELKKRGLQEVETSKADLIVRYNAVLTAGYNATVTDTALATAFGLNPMNGSGYSLTPSGNYFSQTSALVREGSLVVAIYDRGERKLVWEAVDNESLHENRTKAMEQLNKAIESMFKEYPTAGKKS